MKGWIMRNWYPLLLCACGVAYTYFVANALAS